MTSTRLRKTPTKTVGSTSYAHRILQFPSVMQTRNNKALLDLVKTILTILTVGASVAPVTSKKPKVNYTAKSLRRWTTAIARPFASWRKRIPNYSSQSRQWRTPLHFAAYEGREDVAKLLLAKGADVNAVSDKLDSIDLAAVNGKKDLADLLLAKGETLTRRTMVARRRCMTR